MQKRQRRNEPKGKETPKILFTGGHGGTVAITIAEEMTRNNETWKLYWVGPKVAGEGSRVSSIEKKVLEGFGFKFISLKTGKLQRKFTFHTIISLVKIPFGFIHAFLILIKIKPTIVFSLGGFAAVPVVGVANFLRIPILIHDQTGVGLGLGNRLTARFATKILAARDTPILKRYKNVAVVGNPVRKSIHGVPPKFELSKPPVLFIFTGSRGSQIINRAVNDALEDLLEKFEIHHLCGELDLDIYKQRKEKLDTNLAKRYHVYSFIDPNDVWKLYNKSDMIIARAGANTVSEIMLVKRPCLLIPLPIINYSEQQINAEYAKNYGVARVLPQDSLTAKTLMIELDYLVANYSDITNRLKSKTSPDEGSAELVYQEIINLF